MKRAIEKISKVLIDGDILVYKIGFIADAEAKYKYPETWEGENYLPLVLYHVDQVIERLGEKFYNATTHEIFLSGSNNFRKEVATLKAYKGNRKQPKPKYYNEIRQYLVDTHGAVIADREEADDLLGKAQWAKPDKSTVICSIDKDLDMIPGLHYNDKKDKLYEVSLEQANRFFLTQVLTGDSTDNIPGIPGIGPAKAEALLKGKTNDDCVPVIEEAYRKSYGESWAQALSENATLLWIRRKEEQQPPYFYQARVTHGPPQVEDQDADGELRGEVGVREESTDQATGVESGVPIRVGEDPVHHPGEDTHVHP